MSTSMCANDTSLTSPFLSDSGKAPFKTTAWRPRSAKRAPTFAASGLHHDVRSTPASKRASSASRTKPSKVSQTKILRCGRQFERWRDVPPRNAPTSTIEPSSLRLHHCQRLASCAVSSELTSLTSIIDALNAGSSRTSSQRGSVGFWIRPRHSHLHISDHRYRRTNAVPAGPRSDWTRLFAARYLSGGQGTVASPARAESK